MTVQRLRALSLALGLAAITFSAAMAPGRTHADSLINTTTSATLGTVLTDSAGMTLYILSSEANGTLHCVGKCLATWPPLLMGSSTSAPSVAGVNGQFGISRRTDVTGEVTLDGYPLYRFIADKAPGDMHGAGIKALGGVWLPARASGPALAYGVLNTSAPLMPGGSFLVNFTSTKPGNGWVMFREGTGCSALVLIGTRDLSAGTTTHNVLVTGNDFGGMVDTGIRPGATYSYTAFTLGGSGLEWNGAVDGCSSVSVPSP